MPQEDNSSSEVNEALKVFGVVFIANNQATKIEEPGKKPFNFPAPNKPAQGTSVLSFYPAVFFVGSNHFDAIFLHQLRIQSVAVVSFVANHSLWHIGYEAFLQCWLDQFYFSRRSAFCPQGQRKTMAVCNTHDLGALAAFGFPNQSPPFLAGTNVPSTKHSFKSNPPASLRCWARVTRSFSMTPERTQFWNRRCAVWCGPYRGGKSCQGAPVLRIHKTPLITWRRSLHGRPRPSSRTGSTGRIGSTIFHGSSVKSIHNYLYINQKSTSPKLGCL